MFDLMFRASNYAHLARLAKIMYKRWLFDFDCRYSAYEFKCAWKSPEY